MKIRLTLSISLALLFAAHPCRAGAGRDIKSPAQKENRFLFIVDTSAAMRGCSNQVFQAVGDLMESDLRGELRDHDTIGLWTYAGKLNVEFPMQFWSRRARRPILSDMEDFLQEQDFAKQAHLAKFMPAIKEVVTNSDRLTIILISDGSEPIHGTPFDRQINDLQKRYGRELRAAHQPFILALAARHGVLFDYTINYPGTLAIPHTAVPEPVPVTNAPVAVAVVTNVAPIKPHVSHSLIMSAPREVVQNIAPAPAPVIPPSAVVVHAPLVVEPTPTPIPAPSPAPVIPKQIIEPPPETPKPQPPPEAAPVVEQKPPPIAPIVMSPPVTPAAQPTDNQTALFIIAFSLLIIAVVLVVFLIRRARGGPQPSLITQSINRPR